jgi:hypothetical protein
MEFEGWGGKAKFKAETEREFQNAEHGLSPENINEAKDEIRTAATVTATASVKVNLIESVGLLFERANNEPRDAIKRAWELLAAAIFRKANVPSNNLRPLSEDMRRSIRRLERSTDIPIETIESIRSLENIARLVFYHSQFAYDPTTEDARQFITLSVAARNALGDTAK